MSERETVTANVDVSTLIQGTALLEGLQMEGVDVLDAAITDDHVLVLELEGDRR